MKRRQFIKSVAATTAAPMLPSSLGQTLPVSSLEYAKAVEVASKWAYTTAYYLKLALKVDEPTSEAVLAQLQADGIIGPTGPSGICLSEKLSIAKGSGLAKAASEIAETPKTGKPPDVLKEQVLKADERDATVELAEAAEPPATTAPEDETPQTISEAQTAKP